MRTLKHWTSICRPTTHWSCSSNIFPTWKTTFSLWTGNVPNDCIHSIQAILHLLDTLKTESQLAQENFHWKILLIMFQMNKSIQTFRFSKICLQTIHAIPNNIWKQSIKSFLFELKVLIVRSKTWTSTKLFHMNTKLTD